MKEIIFLVNTLIHQCVGIETNLQHFDQSIRAAQVEGEEAASASSLIIQVLIAWVVKREVAKGAFDASCHVVSGTRRWNRFELFSCIDRILAFENTVGIC